MILYILLAAAIVAGVLVARYNWGEGGYVYHSETVDRLIAVGWGALWTAIGAIIAVIAVGVIYLILAMAQANVVSSTPHTTTSNLAALRVDANVKGEFGRSLFAAYGYVGEERVIQYMQGDADGGFKLETAPADDSRIFEGASKPTVEHTRNAGSIWWLVPWPVTPADHDTYKFHLPEGSVYTDDFEVRN